MTARNGTRRRRPGLRSSSEDIDEVPRRGRPWRFFAVALTMPTLGSALGLDGGAIFQIAAVEDLGLDPKTIGLAFALGMLSVPIQILAARLPLWRACRNLQLFLLVAAVECAVLALLVGLDVVGGGFALIALAVTITAEINLSVLYAPSWQPLLNYGLASRERQWVNARARAAGGLVVAGAVLLYGSGGPVLRTAMFAVLGAVALLLAVAARGIPAPDRPVERDLDASLLEDRPTLSPAMRRIYLILAVAGLVTAWPLFLVYADKVLWPGANLGMLGAVQLGGSLLAAASWRSGHTNLGRYAWQASLVLLAATVALAVVRAPVDGTAEQTVTVVALALASAANFTILMAMLERAHRDVDETTSVRAMTLLDVVASTSMQVGLFVGGLLVSASIDRADWLLDPYRIWLVAGTAAVAVSLMSPTFRRTPTD
ncbi:hypothetical protein [Micromonospora echinofusca]|uniref:Major Facilitator Superfamily protein n=1 Tax=Micromonospora echinofusca TaxID=47858 RepID=A0ABS3VVT0_MICEH|nr:hypothetical protein [Micromonospora echinofusca]MBO4208645.1 hypothetical protein [Micromonospora echinofusca]